MARKIKEIHEAMAAELRAKHPDLSTSAVVEWRLLTWVVAVAIHTFEIALGLFRAEIDAVADKNWSGVVDAGTYGLQAMVTLSNYDRTTASASIEVSTMSAGYVDRVMRTQIGANGLFSYWNANKYLYAAENGNGEVFLEVKGKTDMPGVLLWAGGRSGGGTSFYKGAKTHGYETISRMSVGTYKIWHSIGHAEYAINVGIEAYGWCGAWSWRNKTANSIEIVICGLDGQPSDRNFTATLIGQN